MSQTVRIHGKIYGPFTALAMRLALNAAMTEYLRSDLKIDADRLQDPEPPERIRKDMVAEWREYTCQAYAQLSQELVHCGSAKPEHASCDLFDAAARYPTSEPTPLHDAAWAVLAQRLPAVLRDAAEAAKHQSFSLASAEGSESLARSIAILREEFADHTTSDEND